MPGLREKMRPMEEDERRPVTKRSAEVIPIRGAAAETQEEIEKFSAYQALDGQRLSLAQYQSIVDLEERAKEVKVNDTFLENAQSYADHAHIKMHSEEALRLYAFLRDGKLTNALAKLEADNLEKALAKKRNTDLEDSIAKERVANLKNALNILDSLGDKQLLAEVFRIMGKADGLQKLIDAHPEKNIEF